MSFVADKCVIKGGVFNFGGGGGGQSFEENIMAKNVVFEGGIFNFGGGCGATAKTEVKTVKTIIDPKLKDTPTDDKTKECKICFDNEVHVLIKDCGHACLCYGCSRTPGLDKCPICRAAIVKGVQQFFAV